MIFEILRRKSNKEKPGFASYEYEPAVSGETVATALLHLNETLDDPVRFECSCLQKKCGACAMVINGVPKLACDAYLADYKGKIRLEPLKKFPVIADLIVDRSIMQKNLIDMQACLREPASFTEKISEDVYDAAHCLQCGLCLEVCPNFRSDGSFTGAAGYIPAFRILSTDPDVKNSGIYKEYKMRVYDGCAKSLSCEDICPAGIKTGERLAQSNAIAVWHRKKH